MIAWLAETGVKRAGQFLAHSLWLRQVERNEGQLPDTLTVDMASSHEFMVLGALPFHCVDHQLEQASQCLRCVLFELAAKLLGRWIKAFLG
jgi:hypothetical protein